MKVGTKVSKGEPGAHQVNEGRKPQTRSLQENHQEILTNLLSTIIGKPTIVEAQRILKVMDQLLINLETFLYLDSDFISRFLDLSKSKLQRDLVQQLSQETLQLLMKQAEVEQKYKPYANLDQAIKEGEEVDEQKKLESERLEKLLSETFRNLIRRVQRQQQDFDIIRQLKNNVNPELNDLVHCVKCMRIIMLKKLSTAAEEEENHSRQLSELQEKIQSYEKTKNQCEQDLQKLRTERSNNINDKKEEIDNLKNEIAKVKSQKQKRQEMLGKETKAKFDQQEKDHKTKEEKLSTELAQLKTTFNQLKDQNQNEENQLKRRKAASDQLLTESISVYDNMMEEKTAQKQELINECAAIEKQLKDKIEYFKVVDQEKAREKELDEEFKRKRELYEINQAKRNEAAKHMQAFFRSLKKTKGGKKGKKGKK